MNKLKTYTAFFAAALGIVSTGFFYDSFSHMYPGSENVSSSFGFIFGFVSAGLWAIYVLLYLIEKSRGTKKRKK